MTRIFVMLAEFDKQWAKMGLNDNDLKRLQDMLLSDVTAGSVIQGTGGLRKVRFAFENRGKSGSARVVYVDFALYEKVYLISVYSKNEKENLSKAERNDIRKLIEMLESTLKTKGE